VNNSNHKGKYRKSIEFTIMSKVFRDFLKIVNMKYSSVLIVGGIGMVILIAILYNNQEPQMIEQEIIESKDLEFNFNDSKMKEVLDIDKKLDEIEKRADENDFSPAPREWITSGPFQIDRSKYLIGEKIFLRIGALDPHEKGQIAFLKQTNETHYTVFQTIPFDGATKSAFNYYTDIKLISSLGLCSIDDIVGEWTVVFRGTEYKNIKFNILNEILPGEEESFEPVC